MSDLTTINELATQWLALKKSEQAITRDRIKIEQALIVALEFSKPEGSKTEKFDEFKITFTNKLNRKLDVKTWLSIKDSVPENLRPVKEETAYKVDEKGCRWLENNEPELFSRIAQALTITPAKTAVKVEII